MGNHDPPLYRISRPPLFYHKDGHSKIQAASLCEARRPDGRNARTSRVNTRLETRLRIARLPRLLLFWNRLRPVRNVLGTHLHTFFQPGVMKSPPLHVHQILLP